MVHGDNEEEELDGYRGTTCVRGWGSDIQKVNGDWQLIVVLRQKEM